jgi:DNA polymerase I
LLQVHDELIFECRDDVLEEWAAQVTYRFENCVRLNVPIKASTASAPTWGDLEK